MNRQAKELQKIHKKILNHPNLHVHVCTTLSANCNGKMVQKTTAKNQGKIQNTTVFSFKSRHRCCFVPPNSRCPRFFLRFSSYSPYPSGTWPFFVATRDGIPNKTRSWKGHHLAVLIPATKNFSSLNRGISNSDFLHDIATIDSNLKDFTIQYQYIKSIYPMNAMHLR